MVDECVADEEVVDQLGAALKATCEAPLLGNACGEVPQPLRVALVGVVKAAGADLRAGGAEQDLCRGRERLVV